MAHAHAGHYGETTVVYRNKDVLQAEKWDFELPHTRSGLIAAGKSQFEFEVTLDTHTPSSMKGKRGWLSYRLRATLRRSFPKRNIEVVQDVWTFSSSLPAPGPNHLPNEPTEYNGIWEEHLPYLLSYPNKSIYLGQVLPLTIKFGPFLKTSGHVGQELVCAMRYFFPSSLCITLNSKRN